MDVNNISEAFQSKVRLAIVAALFTGSKNFRGLKQDTGATDGNLSVHLSKLEDLAIIASKKGFHQKKPQTKYTLTEHGKTMFKQYVQMLEDIIQREEN